MHTITDGVVKVCEVYDAKDARDIMRACNAHNDLLGACRAALSDLDELGAAYSQVSGVLPQLRAAIAKAERR